MKASGFCHAPRSGLSKTLAMGMDMARYSTDASAMRSPHVGLLLLLLAGSAASLTACGKEIGRIPLRAEGQGEASVQATAGKKLALWTALDVKMTGEIVARYDVELVQDGAVVGKTQCDPFDVNVKTNSKEISLGNDRSVSWSGKMRCELTPTKTGAALVRAKLTFPQRPAALTINDISLVVKE